MGAFLTREQEHIGDLPALMRMRLAASPDVPDALIDGGQLALAAMEAVRHSFLHTKDSGKALVAAQRAFEGACWDGRFTARIEGAAREALERGGALEQFIQGLLARLRATERKWISLAAVEKVVQQDADARLGRPGGERSRGEGGPPGGEPPQAGPGTFLDFVQLAITVLVHAADYQFFGGKKAPKKGDWPGAPAQRDAAVATAWGLLAQALASDAYDAYTKRLFSSHDALELFLKALLLLAVPVIMAA